jgi:ABC-type multidrug transport system ATPase subunit
VGSAHLDGEILYNGDSTDCGKYLIGKVASYVDEKDQHAATLTVDETLDFAWMMTTCGHHSYSVAKDEKSAEILDRDDKTKSKVRASQPCLCLQLHEYSSSFLSPFLSLQLKNIIKILGLSECSSTLVGDASIRGVSGGQKRRVTLGEMLIPPRRIKYMDAISNGLDAATTFDIMQALRFVTHSVHMTTVVSLLQVKRLVLQPLTLIASSDRLYALVIACPGSVLHV